MRFSTEWIDGGPNASAEETVTLCRLRLYVSEENACRFFDPASDRTCDYVTVPAVHLAEGLATDWWSIFGGRDREHAIRKYRTGFALPDVTLRFDGSTFEIRGNQFASTDPDVRFRQVGREGLPRGAAESTLAKFIEARSVPLAVQTFGGFTSRLRQLVAGYGRRVGRVGEVAGQLVGSGGRRPGLDAPACRFDGAELLRGPGVTLPSVAAALAAQCGSRWPSCGG